MPKRVECHAPVIVLAFLVHMPVSHSSCARIQYRLCHVSFQAEDPIFSIQYYVSAEDLQELVEKGEVYEMK